MTSGFYASLRCLTWARLLFSKRLGQFNVLLDLLALRKCHSTVAHTTKDRAAGRAKDRTIRQLSVNVPWHP